jgi:hypothetical protein
MKKSAWGISLVVLILALACVCRIPSALWFDVPRISPVPAADKDGELATTEPDRLYRDDFQNPDSGWEIGDYESGRVGYENGKYVVTSMGNGDTMWGVGNLSFKDVAIEVDATQVSAPDNDNNDYGIVCREQGNGDGYYLLISGDGSYAIIKANREGFTQLVDWRTSEAIRTGNATNHLQAVCDGSRLALFVNGQRLASAEDTEFVGGDIALTATSYESATTEIHFDDLVVRRP